MQSWVSAAAGAGSRVGALPRWFTGAGTSAVATAPARTDRKSPGRHGTLPLTWPTHLICLVVPRPAAVTGLPADLTINVPFL